MWLFKISFSEVQEDTYIQEVADSKRTSHSHFDRCVIIEGQGFSSITVRRVRQLLSLLPFSKLSSMSSVLSRLLQYTWSEQQRASTLIGEIVAFQGL
jgi:hypothetical protein